MENHPLYLLAKRFPQLCIPLEPGARDTSLYKNLVFRGQKSDQMPWGYSFSVEDELKVFPTPAGLAEVLFLKERADFEHCVCALAYRCEPKNIPASMGATTVSGLNDWGKICAYRAEYEQAGGQHWHEEFKRFTADPANFRTTLILVSNGYYSAVPPEAVGLSREEWLQKSLTIRTYHELTHFVCRSRYPADIDPIRDEVIADAIGLIAAFGIYDPQKAALFLGIENDVYRPGGRLENYQKADQPLEPVISSARTWIRHVTNAMGSTRIDDPFLPICGLMTAQYTVEACTQ